MIWLLACTEPSVEQSPLELNLVQASEKVTFKSAEALGPHRLRSVRKQQEYHGEDVRTESTEVLLIDWADWDHWQSTQMVNNEVVSQVWIFGGRCLERVGNKIVERPDGEPYRVQLRNTWNQWDSSIRYFQQGIDWEFVAAKTIDGRKVRHYQASFDQNMVSNSALQPKEFTGNVWVDEDTAVRLVGNLQGVLLNGPYKKNIELTLERQDIGTENVLNRLKDEFPTDQLP